MMMMASLLLCIVMIACVTSYNFPPSLDEVEVDGIFAEITDNMVPIGEEVSLLCHFTNDHDKPINITAILGSLSIPSQYDYVVQNYSVKPYGYIVNPGEEITLSYPLTIRSNVEPVGYTLSSTVFYKIKGSSGEFYSSTYYNATVELYLPIAEYDMESILQLLFSVIVTVVTGFILYVAFSPNKLTYYTNLIDTAIKKKEKVVAVTVNPDENEWLPKQFRSNSGGGSSRKGIR